MRTLSVLFVLVFATLGAVPAGASTTDASHVTIVHAYGAGALLTWEPAPGADAYAIYRVDAAGHATFLGETRSTIYFDFGAPDVGRIDYDVQVLGTQWDLPRAGTGAKGECVYANSNGAASVTVKDCREATVGDGER